MPFPSTYEIKKALMWPRTLYMRRKERALTGFIKAALELHYYRPSLYRFYRDMENEDLLYSLEGEIDQSSLVLDVGAFTGEWAEEIFKRCGSDIYAFEPNSRNYKKLERRANKSSGIKPQHYGMGDETFTAKISQEGIGSSLYETDNQADNIKWEDIQIKAVDDVWRDLGLGQVQLMKINIEGAEFPLLEKMIKLNMLGNVDCFMIQFHEWHPGAYWRRYKIQRALKKTHRLVWDYHFVWEKWVKR